ncbi:hypothetical protein AALG83_02165 [Christensenellaceae bacterium 44-20]
MAKEYIERGKLKDELIDLTPYAMCNAQINSDIDMYTVMGIIDEQTVSDVVEVVRCKDCSSYKQDSPGLGWCPVVEFVRLDNDFCSYGERRDSNEAD